jgi:hypothetical protein
MGIRIHKAIGYGLNDIKTDEYRISDDRFNITDEWWEDLYESDFSDFEAFLKDKDGCIKILIEQFGVDPQKAEWDYGNIKLFLNSISKMRHPPHNDDFFDYDGESTDNWMLFYPAGNVRDGMFGSWYRHDDTIDYYENRVYKKELEPVIVDLSKYGTLGLYPYDHGMYLKPGRKNKLNEKQKGFLNKNNKNHIEGGWYNQLVGDWDSKLKPLADEETIKHLKEDWHPVIPTSIKLFTYYFKFFKNPHTVYDFKPLLCQWWG